ncbi:unnamed protein product, partial [Darwinula stevensoni]
KKARIWRDPDLLMAGSKERGTWRHPVRSVTSGASGGCDGAEPCRTLGGVQARERSFGSGLLWFVLIEEIPHERQHVKHKKPSQWVYFFGTEDYAWIEEENIKPYANYREKFSRGGKGGLKKALEAIEEYVKGHPEALAYKPEVYDYVDDEESGKFPTSAPAKKSKDTKNESVLDVETLTDTLKGKKIEPSTLKFGFLGLGNMGSGIVKNLLNSGHSVSVWNRTPDKCGNFVKAGAVQSMTPEDVVTASDIIFCCMSDPQVSKQIIYGNCGVLSQMTAAKGFVEMTTCDPEHSRDVAEAINGKEARYLEAQIQGNKELAKDGNLVILAAGDRSLFEDCASCFTAMATSSVFVGTSGEVGNASKINLLLQAISGVSIAALGECMAVCDRTGIQLSDFTKILEKTQLASPLLLGKAKAIVEGSFPPETPLSHIQKDLRLAVGLGDSLDTPMSLSATANEVYKHAKRIGYADHDVSAVYIRSRF